MLECYLLFDALILTQIVCIHITLHIHALARHMIEISTLLSCANATLTFDTLFNNGGNFKLINLDFISTAFEQRCLQW